MRRVFFVECVCRVCADQKYFHIYYRLNLLLYQYIILCAQLLAVFKKEENKFYIFNIFKLNKYKKKKNLYILHTCMYTYMSCILK